jgi:hypothetical protein
MRITEDVVIDILKDIFGKEKVVRLVPGPYSKRGIPDLVITAPVNEGVPSWMNNTAPVDFFCEIKTRKTKLTKLQVEFLKNRVAPLVIEVDDQMPAVRVYSKFFPAKIGELARLLRQLTNCEYWETEHYNISEVLS